MFFKRKNVSAGAKKIDKVITGLIIGTAVASMIGLSKTSKGKEVTNNIKNEGVGAFKKGYSVFGKCLVGVIKFFNKK
ncbi:MAG: hypothetical protein PHH98_03535 [Candidatus Gracilibacteria bacterium]|nr:hypothetical protein [Candidatus Gracilibacteria bacterium]